MALASLIYAGKKYWNNALRTPEEIRNMSETLFRRMLLFAWDNTEFYPFLCEIRYRARRSGCRTAGEAPRADKGYRANTYA